MVCYRVILVRTFGYNANYFTLGDFQDMQGEKNWLTADDFACQGQSRHRLGDLTRDLT